MNIPCLISPEFASSAISRSSTFWSLMISVSINLIECKLHLLQEIWDLWWARQYNELWFPLLWLYFFSILFIYHILYYKTCDKIIYRFQFKYFVRKMNLAFTTNSIALTLKGHKMKYVQWYLVAVLKVNWVFFVIRLELFLCQPTLKFERINKNLSIIKQQYHQ